MQESLLLDDEGLLQEGAGRHLQQPDPAAPKASTCGAVINLSNTVLGAGVLAMPYACSQCGLVLFTGLLTSVAVGAHLSIRMLAISMDKHQMTSTARYASLGERAYGRLGSSVAMLAIFLQQLGPCIIYIQITADILVPILCEANPWFVYETTTDDCNADHDLRSTLQLAVVVLCMLPLSMIKSMDSLKFASAISMFFMSAFAALVVLRGIWVLRYPSIREDDYAAVCLSGGGGADGSSTGQLVEEPAAGSTPKKSGWYCDTHPGKQLSWWVPETGNPIKAVPIICFAFLCHQNIFPVFQQLDSPTHRTMTKVSGLSVALCWSVYYIVGVFGYATFLRRAETSKGDILNLFTVSTKGVGWFPVVTDVSRLGYGLSIVLSYPIMLFELRHVVMTAIGASLCGCEGCAARLRVHPDTVRNLVVNVALIGPCTAIALVVGDPHIVFGFIGSTMSPLIVFILPALFCEFVVLLQRNPVPI